MLVQILRFPLWWYQTAPSHFPYLFKNIDLLWEDLFAIRLMWRFLFAPLFHDVTIWGRVLSVLYRSGRIVSGLTTLLLVDIFLVVFFILWFILPFCLIYLVYLEPKAIALVLIFPLTALLVGSKDSPKKISDFQGQIDFKSASGKKLKNILESPKSTYLLLTEILTHPGFEKTLEKMGLVPPLLLSEVEKNKENLATVIEPEKLQNLILEKAKTLSSENLKLGHLFLVLLDSSKILEDFLERLDLEKKLINEAFVWCEEGEKSRQPKYLWDADFRFDALAGVNRTLEGAVTPSLESYIRDLTAEAKRGVLPPVVERKELVERIGLILSRSGQNNVILVGEPGCGKTYLAYGLAQKIVRGGAPSALRFKRVAALDYSALLGGTKTEGEILERMKKIIDEIEYSGNIILFLDEIQNLIAGDSQRNAVYSALEPHLSSAKFQVIAAASFENYHATLEQNEELANLFQMVEVPEASKEETLAILKMVAQGFEKRQKVIISFPALLATIELSKRYIQDRVLPDKAVSILDEAAVLAATHSPNRFVGKEEVAKVIALKTHLPVTKVTAEESKKLLDLENILHQRLIDQNEAVTAVSDALRRARAGVGEEGRPIASFLFIGPTGVGKTELARTLAEFYFGSEETMVRLDMSEFQNQESLFSLIGPPMGEKGSELGGRLTEAIRRRPFSLLLLDEMEKAHEDILNLFLQVLDEARLTDSAGRTVDFSNAIIIATSNAATSLIQAEITKGTPMEKIRQIVSEFLKTVFRPEFLNRFDGIIVFKPLSPQEVEMIAQLMVKKLTDNLTQKGIKVEVKPGLLAKLAQMGYDPTLGARPLRRLIQDKVEAKIAKEILGGELRRGSTLILDETILNVEKS